MWWWWWEGGGETSEEVSCSRAHFVFCKIDVEIIETDIGLHCLKLTLSVFSWEPFTSSWPTHIIYYITVKKQRVKLTQFGLPQLHHVLANTACITEE